MYLIQPVLCHFRRDATQEKPNFEEFLTMKNSERRIYDIVELFLGFILINGLHFLIKNYDLSFEGIWDYGTRGIYFHFFFVITGVVFWRLGQWLAFKIQSSISFNKLKYWFRIISGTLIFLTYGILVSISFGAFYYKFFYQLVDQEIMWKDYHIFDQDFSMIILIFYFVITGFINLVLYFRNWKEAQVVAEQLKKENVQSKFEALKNQIDPHFFFNSLSVLSSLVHKDANLSEEYISQLSKMYRYILDGKDQVLASLDEELNFLNSYIFLIKVRFNENIHFEINIADELKETVSLPKNSLQMLVENAIKHNRFDQDDPLVITILEEGDYIKVVNNKNKRDLLERSSGIGLENISKRYQLLGDFKLLIWESDDSFAVKLPKLSKNEIGYFAI